MIKRLRYAGKHSDTALLEPLIYVGRRFESHKRENVSSTTDFNLTTTSSMQKQAHYNAILAIKQHYVEGYTIYNRVLETKNIQQKAASGIGCASFV
jgi:hypothetical protein